MVYNWTLGPYGASSVTGPLKLPNKFKRRRMMKSKKLTSILMATMLTGFGLTPAFADQVLGDAVVTNTSNHDQTITLNVTTGDTWNTDLSVYIKSQGQNHVNFDDGVSGTVTNNSGVEFSKSTWKVNSYTEPDKVTASKKETTSGQFTYIVYFNPTSDLGAFNQNNPEDFVKIIVNVADPVDTTAPVITVPDKVTQEATAEFTMVELTGATTDDPTATLINNANILFPNGFPYGTSTITWTATDTHGNVSTATQDIEITDHTAPELTVPADIEVEATAVETQIDIGMATATDIFNVKISKDRLTDLYPLGTTVVTWTADDNHGNLSTATQNITVKDTTAPVFTLKPETIKTVLTGSKTQVNLGEVKATDIFGATITNDAPNDGFPVGTTTVTWTAKDPNGNTTTVTQKVVVNYAFEGISQPINTDGTSVFKQGSTIPVKFQLKNANGEFVTNAEAHISVTKVGAEPSVANEAVSTSAASTGDLFRYDVSANQYIFNLSTKPLASGSKYQITVSLNDGTSYSVIIGLK